MFEEMFMGESKGSAVSRVILKREGTHMQVEEEVKQKALDDLYWKWFLTDLKTNMVQVICSLMENQDNTREELLISLMEIVDSIELEEKMVNTRKIKENLLVSSEMNK